MAEQYQFKDKGSNVEIVIPITDQNISVDSKTTSLSVKGANGQSILSVPQLQGTVDAGKTKWHTDETKLTLTLHKLGNEAWPSLETTEVSTSFPPGSP